MGGKLARLSESLRKGVRALGERRAWINLWEYQRRYGVLTYQVPDGRTDPRTCMWCHGPLPTKRHKSFCSTEHSQAWQQRYVWNRNRNPVAWRILCRDRFACQDCGEMSGYKNEFGVWIFKPTGLEVHHIVHVADGGEDHESNLVTLCADCHLARHGKKRKEHDHGTDNRQPSNHE